MEAVPEMIRTMVADIEAAAAKLRSETKAVVLGPDAVQAQKPEDRPARPKKSYAPLFQLARGALRFSFELNQIFLELRGTYSGGTYSGGSLRI
jgi:hypothetical protein